MLLLENYHYVLGDISKNQIFEAISTEQSSSDVKGPGIYGVNLSKAASKPQPPKTLFNLTSRESCNAKSKKGPEESSISKTNAKMHPPVDYQATPTHPHGTMTSVPIPFQPIHDYAGNMLSPKYLV